MSRVCRGGPVGSGCARPQTQLPIFPASGCAITPELAFEQRDGVVGYFKGHLPVCSHPTTDLAAFRRFFSQLIAKGAASQVQIARAFAGPLVTVKRACKKRRLEGAAGCFRPPTPRQGYRLTAAVLAAAQALLDAGIAPAEVAARLGVLPNPLNKVRPAGRLKKARAAGVAEPVGNPRGSPADAAAAAPAPAATPATQSARSVADGQALMGVATTRSLERVAQLRAGRKQFLDTSKLIAYRAKSARGSSRREKMSRHDDARSLVRGHFASTINLRPDATGTELRSELHGQANPAHDALVEHLGAERNRTETHYSGTTLRRHFTTLRSATFPSGQDV